MRISRLRLWTESFQGFRGDGINCKDVDECDEEKHECVNSQCDNSEGSYRCNCDTGIRLLSVVSLEQNRGSLEQFQSRNIYLQPMIRLWKKRCWKWQTVYWHWRMHRRSSWLSQQCILQQHSWVVNLHLLFRNRFPVWPYLSRFYCELWKGFYGDGKICGDSDECSADIYQLSTLDNTTDLYNLATHYNSTLEHNVTAPHDCHAHATCNNTIGSFSCECNSGKRLLISFEVLSVYKRHFYDSARLFCLEFFVCFP